jgi:hypothetical protein
MRRIRLSAPPAEAKREAGGGAALRDAPDHL